MGRRGGGRRGGRRGGPGSAGGAFGRMAGHSFRTPRGRAGGGPGGRGPGGRGQSPGGRNRPGGNRSRSGQDPRATSRQPNGRTTTNDPIDVVTGEVLLSQTDLDLPGALPLLLERTHISTYRDGGLFGDSWASTLDQRLELDPEGVYFLAADAITLKYPQAMLPNVQFRPVEGPQWPLVLTADGGYTVTDPYLGRILHFPAPGEELGWSRLPLTRISDRNGNRIDLIYEDQVLVEIRHSGGYRIAVDTADVEDADVGDGGRRLMSLRLLTDAADGQAEGVRLIRYGYDENGRLTEVVNSSGRPLRFSYDDDGRLTGWHDRNDFWYRYDYDTDGRAIRGFGSGDFLNSTLAYSPDTRTTVVTDALGRPTTYRYDEAFQIIAETDSLGATTRSEWDRYDRLLSRTDPLGATTRYGYDEQGNLTSVTNPDGTRRTARYNELNLPVEIVEASGATWLRTWDDRGNLVQGTDPSGAVTAYARDDQGNLTALTDALGQTTHIEYNTAGLPVTVTDPLGSRALYAYDAFGRITAATDPLGGITRFGWTLEGKPAWRTLPDGSTEHWSHDPEGNLTSYTDAAGQVTRTEVGAFDVPTAQVGPDGDRLEFAHDAELRLTSVTNELGLSWRYEYDAAGNLVKETDFNGRLVEYAYDVAGRLTERTNGAGQTVSFTRDVTGRVTERRAGEVVTTFAYDADGRLERAAAPGADLRFERDPLGRVIAEVCNGHAVTSGYDAVGRRTVRRTPSGAESVWAYDAAGQPAGLATAGQYIGFEHDHAGREVQRRIGGGAVLSQQWDSAHRLTAQTVWGAPAGTPQTPSSQARLLPQTASSQARLLQHRTYAYRADGVVTATGDRLTGDRVFDLDARGRVTTVNARGWSEHYVYDAAGDLIEATWPGRQSETPEAAGRREYSGTLLRQAGTARFEYDQQGRVVLRQHTRLSSKPANWRYEWDAEDRLVAVQTPDGQRWRYQYDALGRRIAKLRILPDGSGVAEQLDFVWDGAVLAEQVHRTWSPEHGAYIGRGTVWEYEPETLRPVAQTERIPARDAPQQWVDQQFYAIVTDLVGTPTELIAPEGDVAWHPITTLWGEHLASTPGPATCPLRFPGQYHDPETGLNYNFHRYYDASTARYESSDPLGLAPAFNPYAYVRNPLAEIDLLGLAPYYSAQSRRHVYSHGHAANSPQIPGKSRFRVTEGGKKFTDEIVNHPNVQVTHQANGRVKYEVPNLNRGFTGWDRHGNRVYGGRVIVEGQNPPSWSTYAPDEVVTQFPV
ncbi:RHS repeat-associated core domain-containing protein [Actinomadura sp. 6N118]|uniref:RHS repeat-associated core domain-containing protein n=1 Tax=Actinomadura sp. 6N118 TaxID=3375151 RepID=UPI003795DCEC